MRTQPAAAQANNPLKGKPTLGQLLHGFRYYDDYHDWACRNITPFYNRSLMDGIRYVGRLGVAGMLVNTVYGIGVLAISILAIARCSAFRRSGCRRCCGSSGSPSPSGSP